MNQKTSRLLALFVFLGLSSEGALSAKELWVPPTHLASPRINIFPWPTTASGYASFGFAVPGDFAAFTTATIAVIPRSNFNGTFDVYGSVKRDGETAVGGFFQDLGMPANLTAGEMAEIDITSLLGGQLDASSAGSDYVSVFFWFPSSPALEHGTILGMRFVYEPVPLTSAEIGNGAITGLDVADGSLGASDVNLAQIQARVTGSCPAGQSIRAIGIAGTVTCEPAEPPAPDWVLWVNPLSMIPDEDGAGGTTLSLSRGAAGTTLRVTTTQAGDLQWLNLPLVLDSRFAIKAVTLCYDLSNASSFISQIRLTEETLPPSALVRHDDATDRTSVASVCVDSPVGNLEPEGSMTLALRLNFASTAHHIDIGAVGFTLGMP